MSEFRGVYAVTLTPFDDNDRIDLELVASHVDYLIEGGVHGIICLGSTGEFASLTDDERDQVLRTTLQASAGRAPVVSGASANGSNDVVRYCSRAHELGADGVMLVHPFYCQPTQRELLEHYKYVSARTDLPIMIYNNPFTSGVDLMPETINELSYLDNIVCVKECSGDARRTGEILRLCGDRLTVFAGSDDLFIEGFAHGATGWVCGAANVLPRAAVRIFELAVEQRDIMGARELSASVFPFFFMVETEGAFVQYLKAGMEIIGRPMGSPRRPLLPVTDEVRSRISAAIAQASGASV